MAGNYVIYSVKNTEFWSHRELGLSLTFLLWPWASYLVSMDFSFFICKMR